MKPKSIVVYEAWDGTRFDSVSDCLRYERDQSTLRIVGLTEDQVMAALSYEEPAREIADALEIIGFKIRTARRAKGLFKREREREPV